MVADRVVEGIPRDFDELFRKYGGLIAAEIRRKNVVAGQFEDHYQNVCEKLVAAQVLTKFRDRVLSCSDDDLPETITGADIAVLFTITFSAWRSKMWSYHKVFVEMMRGKAPDGETHGTIVNANGKDVSWVSWMPTPISGGYSSPKAVFKTSDVLAVPDLGYFRTAKPLSGGGWTIGLRVDTTAWPRRKVQPHHFTSYLSRAIQNHFWNGCRTIMRKQKERPGDCFSQYKTPEGDYDTNWVDNIPDAVSAQDIDNVVDMNMGIERLQATITPDQQGEISTLLARKYTIREAVKMASSLSVTQKRTLLSMTEG